MSPFLTTIVLILSLLLQITTPTASFTATTIKRMITLISRTTTASTTATTTASLIKHPDFRRFSPAYSIPGGNDSTMSSFRVAGAKYLLDAMVTELELERASSPWGEGMTVDELDLVRDSFVLQPAYFDFDQLDQDQDQPSAASILLPSKSPLPLPLPLPMSLSHHRRKKNMIVFENDSFLIVDKPFDVQIELKKTQRPRYDGEPSVIGWFKEAEAEMAPDGGDDDGGDMGATDANTDAYADVDVDAGAANCFLKPCHTLDFATSGLLVLAKSQQALSAGSQAFGNHARSGSSNNNNSSSATTTTSGGSGNDSSFYVEKEYLAVVFGRWEGKMTVQQQKQKQEQEGTAQTETMNPVTVLRGAIGPDPSSEFKMRVVVATQEKAEEEDEFNGVKSGVKGEIKENVEAVNDSPESLSSSSTPSTSTTGSGVINAGVASRWGPSRLPAAPRWTRDSRARVPSSPRGTTAAHRYGRAAETRVELLKRGRLILEGPLKGRTVSLLRLWPATGRRHQLRCHLAHAGFPIVGDVCYAGDISSYRLMLHAYTATFCCDCDDQQGSGGGSGSDGEGGSEKSTGVIATDNDNSNNDDTNTSTNTVLFPENTVTASCHPFENIATWEQ